MMVQKRFIVAVVFATAIAALQWRTVDALGATMSFAGVNFSVGGAQADSLHIGNSASAEGDWRDKSLGSKPAFDVERRDGSSPLKQLFQSRAQDLYADAQEAGDDAYHGDVSRVLGPLMAVSTLMPLSDNVCVALDSVNMAAMPSHNVAPHRWRSVSDSPAESPATGNAIPAGPAPKRRVVMPVESLTTVPDASAPSRQSVTLIFPIIVGFVAVFGYVFWKYLRYRRSLTTFQDETVWSEEAEADDPDRASQSVLFASFALHENRRMARTTRGIPMTAATAKEEIRRAA